MLRAAFADRPRGPVSRTDAAGRRAALAGSNALVGAGYVALLLVGVLAHELAHDETQAWAIARTADWPWQIPWLNRYEGHPPTWAVLLWPLTRTGDPLMLQLLSAGIAVAAVALLLGSRPFPTPALALVPFGSFVLYDFAVLARPYGLAMLLCAGLATLLRSGHDRPLGPAALCAGLAATSAYGIVLSVPLALFSAVEVLRRRRPGAAEALGAAAMYGGVALVAGLSVVLPVAATEFEASVRGGERVDASFAALAVVLNAFPHFRTLPLGVGEWLMRPGPYAALVGAGLVVLGAVAVRLRRAPHALLAWALACASIVWLVMRVGATEERYVGHAFLAALTLLWVVEGRTDDPAAARSGLDRAAAAVLVLVLAWHAAVGVASIGYDVLIERTPWRRMANDLAPALAEPGAVLLDDYGYPSVTVLAWLDEPAAWGGLCGGCRTRFSRWDRTTSNDPRDLRAAWCERETAGVPVVALTERERFLDIPGVTSLGVWGPGRRDRLSHPVLALRLDDPSTLCAPGADTLFEGTPGAR